MGKNFVLDPNKDAELFTEFIRDVFRNAVVEETGDHDDEMFLAKLSTEVNRLALQRTIDMKESDLVYRSILHQTNDAETNGWHHLLEYNTVEEMLNDMISSANSQYWKLQLQGVLEVLIPMARSLGFDETELWRVGDPEMGLLKKASRAVPALKNADAERAKEIIGDVLDPEVSAEALRLKLRFGDIQEYEAKEFYVSGDQSYILLPINNDRQRAGVKQALRKLPGLEDGISVTDVMSVINVLSKHILKG